MLEVEDMSSDIKKYVARTKPASCSDGDSPMSAACDLGQFDGKPVQPKLQKYAPKKYGAKQRDFQSTCTVADRGWNFQWPWRRHSVTVAGNSPTEVIHTLLLQDSPTGNMYRKRQRLQQTCCIHWTHSSNGSVERKWDKSQYESGDIYTGEWKAARTEPLLHNFNCLNYLVSVYKWTSTQRRRAQ